MCAQFLETHILLVSELAIVFKLACNHRPSHQLCVFCQHKEIIFASRLEEYRLRLMMNTDQRYTITVQEREHLYIEWISKSRNASVDVVRVKGTIILC